MLKEVSLKDLSNKYRTRKQIGFYNENTRFTKPQKQYSFDKKSLGQQIEIKMNRILKHNRELLNENQNLSMRLAEQLRHHKMHKEFNFIQNDYPMNKKIKQFGSSYNIENKSKYEYENQIRYLQREKEKFISTLNDFKKQRDQNLMKIQTLTIQLKQMSDQSQTKIGDLMEKLNTFENLVSQSEKKILQLESQKSVKQQELNHIIDNLTQENKQLKQEVKYYKQNYERDMSILRQENQKKQLEIIYIQKITEQELEKKDRQIQGISRKIRSKKQQENQVIQVLRILEREKQELQENYQQLTEKYQKLQKEFITLKKEKSKQCQQKKQEKEANQKKQIASKSDLAPNNLDKFKILLSKKQSQIQELNDQIEQLREINDRLKRKNEQLLLKYKQTEKNLQRKIQDKKQVNAESEIENALQQQKRKVKMLCDELESKKHEIIELKEKLSQF